MMGATTNTGSTQYAARSSGGSGTSVDPAAIWRRGARNQLSMASHNPSGSETQLSGTATSPAQSKTSLTPMASTAATSTKGSRLPAMRVYSGPGPGSPSGVRGRLGSSTHLS